MKTRTWLVVGLTCALAGSASAQQASPVPPAAPATPAKAPAKAPGKAPAKKKDPKGPKVDLSPLVADLSGANQETAVKAAEQLGASMEPAAHEALLDALAFGMQPAVAIASIKALAMHPAPPDVNALVRYATHHNPSVRSASYGALALYPDPVAQKAIVRGLHDELGPVRAAAAAAAAKGRVRIAVEPMLELLGRGEQSASAALASMADLDLARKIGDQLGKMPDAILAQTLGAILKRSDFGPDEARVDIVRAIGKIQGPEAITALTDYVDATPKNPPRPSRAEAQKMVEARLGGGK
ncbi:MAG TPA: HEAT repeat domain-containing protein [Kofleriaceae bacterium]|nr:HEAT repeat domain-containing protein [Kofleriaceae bacterium]